MNLTTLAAALLLAASSTAALAVGGIADLTIYDRSDGRTLPIHWHEGRAWVVGKPGNEPVEVAPLSRQAPPASAAESAGSGSEFRSKSMRDDRLGTGHGRSEVSPVGYTSFERATHQPAETVV